MSMNPTTTERTHAVIHAELSQAVQVWNADKTAANHSRVVSLIDELQTVRQ